MNKKIVYELSKSDREDLTISFEEDSCRIVYTHLWHDSDEEWEPFDPLDNNLLIPLDLLPMIKEGIEKALIEWQDQTNKSNK